MRVATKIVISSALLAGAFGSVAVSQAVLARSLTARQRSWVENQSVASRILADQRADVEEMFRHIGRYEARDDPEYAERALGLADEFTQALRELHTLDLPEPERLALARITQQWSQLRPILVPPDFTELHGPLIEQRYRQEVSDLQLSLGQQIDQALELDEASSRELVALLDAKRRESRRIASSILLAALALSALVVVLTVRSINRPLARLVEGTRAVASGDFEVRFAAERDDEFARLADALDQMTQRLGEIDRLKKDFMAHVSHELKTPLVAMQETNRLLLDELPGPLTAKQRRLLELNLSGGRRLSAMLSNLLDLSRLEAGVVEYDKKQHDLREVAELVVDEFAARARELGVRLKLECAAQPVLAAFDRDRLIQVVENLVDNALKFSPSGAVVGLSVETAPDVPKGAPRTWRRRWRPGRRKPLALLSVTDSGPGVPPGRREWIFRRFHQLRRPASGGAGVGLGLAICREIVLAHEGALWVDGRSERGSIFRLLLPAKFEARSERLSA